MRADRGEATDDDEDGADAEGTSSSLERFFVCITGSDVCIPLGAFVVRAIGATPLARSISNASSRDVKSEDKVEPFKRTMQLHIVAESAVVERAASNAMLTASLERRRSRVITWSTKLLLIPTTEVESGRRLEVPLCTEFVGDV